MDTTQKLIVIQAVALLGFGLFRLYMFLFARAKDKE